MLERSWLDDLVQRLAPVHRRGQRAGGAEAIARVQPLGDLGLGIHVDEQDGQAAAGQAGGDVHGDRRFADAVLAYRTTPTSCGSGNRQAAPSPATRVGGRRRRTGSACTWCCWSAERSPRTVAA